MSEQRTTKPFDAVGEVEWYLEVTEKNKTHAFKGTARPDFGQSIVVNVKYYRPESVRGLRFEYQEPIPELLTIELPNPMVALQTIQPRRQLNVATTSKVRKVQLMHAGHGEYYWHAKGGNGAVILDGGEKLSHKKRLIKFIHGEWPHATIDVLDTTHKVVEKIEPIT